MLLSLWSVMFVGKCPSFVYLLLFLSLKSIPSHFFLWWWGSSSPQPLQTAAFSHFFTASMIVLSDGSGRLEDWKKWTIVKSRSWQYSAFETWDCRCSSGSERCSMDWVQQGLDVEDHLAGSCFHGPNWCCIYLRNGGEKSDLREGSAMEFLLYIDFACEAETLASCFSCFPSILSMIIVCCKLEKVFENNQWLKQSLDSESCSSFTNSAA